MWLPSTGACRQGQKTKREKRKKKSWLKDEFLVMGNMSRERRLNRHADVGCRIPAMPSWKSDWVSWFQRPGAPGGGWGGGAGGSCRVSCAKVMIQCQRDLRDWVQSAAGEGQTSRGESYWWKGRKWGKGRERGRREREQSKEWLMVGEREGERRKQRLTERGRSRRFSTF